MCIHFSIQEERKCVTQDHQEHNELEALREQTRNRVPDIPEYGSHSDKRDVQCHVSQWAGGELVLDLHSIVIIIEIH